MSPGPVGTVTTLVVRNGLLLKWGDYVDILVPFSVSPGFPLRPPLPGRAQRKQDKRQSWNLSLSSLPRAESFPRRSRGPFPCLRSLAPVRRPSFRGRFDVPPPHGAVPVQPVVCSRRVRRQLLTGGTERNKWLKQASRPLGSRTVLFQPPDMCFSGNAGNYLCPLGGGGLSFSACGWGFQAVSSSQAPSGPGLDERDQRSAETP